MQARFKPMLLYWAKLWLAINWQLKIHLLPNFPISSITKKWLLWILWTRPPIFHATGTPSTTWTMALWALSRCLMAPVPPSKSMRRKWLSAKHCSTNLANRWMAHLLLRLKWLRPQPVKCLTCWTPKRFPALISKTPQKTLAFIWTAS